MIRYSGLFIIIGLSIFVSAISICASEQVVDHAMNTPVVQSEPAVLEQTNTSPSNTISPAYPFIDTLPNPVTLQGDIHNSGYISVGGKVKHFFHDPAFLATIHGGWVINEQVYIGGAVHGLFYPDVILEFSGQSVDINLIYAGMETGIIIPLLDQLKLRPQVLLGFTSIFYNFQEMNGHSHDTGNDTIVIEPSVYADFMVLDSLMLSLGLGYHFSLGVEFVEGIRNWDVNSPTIEILVSFVGW
ncbi:hypothetical protein K8S19_02820 [bacterium]|nr:hypothetical protein [bacterium]